MYLAALGWFDIREQKVPVMLLKAGTAVAVWKAVYSVFKDPSEWQWKVLLLGLGILPGLFMIALSIATGKVGAGDGWVLVNVGLFTDYKTCMFLWVISLIFMSFFSVIFLFMKRVRNTTRIPYLPFLAAVEIVGTMFKGGVL